MIKINLRAFSQWILIVLSGCFSLISVADTAENRVIQHALGSSQITGTPLRVVTLFQGATDTAVALGAQPVGVVESWTHKPVYPYLRSALEGVANVGLETQPNLERILKLKPDLIIAAKFRHEKIYSQLSAIAPVIALDQVFNFKHTLKLMAEALNRQSQGQELMTRWQQRVTEFNKQTMQQTWPINVSILNFRADHIRLYSQHSFAGSILQELGFTRPNAKNSDDWVYKKLTSREALPSVNADAFFIFMREDNQAVVDNYQKWSQYPLWHRLNAVKKQQVYTVDDISWRLSGGILGANAVLDDLFRLFANSANTTSTQ